MSGETVRVFMRDRNNNYFAVLRQAYGAKEIIGATRIDPRSFCEHVAEEQEPEFFTAFPAVTEAVVKMLLDRELQFVELPCTDAAHWLTILAESEVEIQSLEAEYERKKSAAKAAKDAVDQAISRQRDNIRRATKPQDEVPPIIALAEANPPVVSDESGEKAVDPAEPESIEVQAGEALLDAIDQQIADADAPAVDPEQGF